MPKGYLPLLLATFGPFADGTFLRVSDQPLSVVQGGSDYGVQYAGHDYDARIILNEQQLARIQAYSPQGYFQIPSVTLPLHDPDSHIYLTYEMANGKGFKGINLTLDLVLFDPINKVFSSDSIRKFYGVCELPKRTRRHLSVQASSLKNPQIVNLPTIHIQPRCWKLFPVTPAQGQDGADNRSSPWWDCGYSPTGSGGNARGNVVGGVHALDCNRTKANCIERGMYDKDSANRITRRFGGFQWNGPTSFKGKSFFDNKTVIGYNFTNEARYNDLIPLAYGTTWIDCAILQPLGDPNSDRFEAVVCYGELGNNGIIKVVANDVEIPHENPNDKLFLWRYVNQTGSPGDRTGGFNTDALYDGKGDPYGSIVVIELVLPTALAQSSQISRVRVLSDTQKIPVPDTTDNSIASSSAWPRQFTRCPVWILLDLLVWSNWQYSEIDIASFQDAATVCNTSVAYTDQNGASNTHPRFEASATYRHSRSAADIIQALCNNFGGVLVPNANGNLLQLVVRQTLGDQQSSPMPGSNYNIPIASTDATGASKSGYVAMRCDESNIIAETLESDPKTSADTGNRLTISFINTDNQWSQDSISTTDSLAVAASGNQELPVTYPVDGITSFDQGNRRINTRFAELFRGNPRGDARGTIRYGFELSTGGIHLRVADIIMLSWQQDGIIDQLFRVEDVGLTPNSERVRIIAAWHRDGWYQDNYGTFADPFYSDPRKETARAFPYNWEPFGEVNIGDSMYPLDYSSFAVIPSYENQADGTALTKLQILGRPPANVAGKADPPNVPLGSPDGGVTTPNSGGTFTPGNYLVGVSSVDTDGHWSFLSKLMTVVIPAGTNTNQIVLNRVYFPSNATDCAVFIAEDGNEFLLATNGLIGSASSTITIPDPQPPNIGPPDVKFDHFHVRAKRIIHAGVVGAALASVGTATVSIPFAGASATDQFKNHILSLIGLVTPDNPVPILNVMITGSTCDGTTLTLTLSETLGAAIVGDIVVIRALASSITTNTIGDAEFVNALSPGGIADSETNLLLKIIAGTGAMQEKRILSNTTTVYTIEGTWDITPDATSIFIVVEQAWQWYKPTDTWSVATPLPLNPQVISDNYLDNPLGGTYLVQVLTEDVNNNSGPDRYAPFREIYIPGSPGNSISVGTVWD